MRYKLPTRVRKNVTGYHDLNDDGSVEKENQTIDQVLEMTVNERRDSWDISLLHVEIARYNSVSASISRATDEIDMSRLPRLTFAVV